MASELGQFFDDMYVAEQRVVSFRDMLELLVQDMHLAQRGLKMRLAIDYSELFRYLHPELDRTQHVSVDLFYNEQVAIHYLFEVMQEPLILLPPYVEELHLHLTDLRTRLLVRRVGLDDTSPRLDQREKKLLERLDELLATEQQSSATDLSDGLRPWLKRGLDLATTTGLEQRLTKAMDRLQQSLNKGKLIHIRDLPDVPASCVTFNEQQEEYQHVLREVFRARPDKNPETNEADARAAYQVKSLTEHGKDLGLYYCLVSNARRLYGPLMSLRIQPQGTGVDMPILRNLDYYLLRLFYEDSSVDEVLRLAEPFRSSGTRFLVTLERARAFLKMKQLTDEVTDEVLDAYGDISNHLDTYGKLYPMRLHTELFEAVRRGRPLSREDLLDLAKSIRDTFRDVGLLRQRLEQAVAALDEAIAIIEQRLIDIGAADFGA